MNDMTSDQEKVLAYLNSIFAADPAAIHALMANRVPCTYNAGTLGLLNGLLTSLGIEKVAMHFDDSEIKEGGFGKFTGFVKYEGSK
jgi:hypothetical protein